jgi:hypothetical protein
MHRRGEGWRSGGTGWAVRNPIPIGPLLDYLGIRQEVCEIRDYLQNVSPNFGVTDEDIALVLAIWCARELVRLRKRAAP